MTPTPRTTAHAVILFGHGSRDPLWRQPIEAVAARIAVLAPERLVRCAYLELSSPDLPSVAAELSAAGAASVTVVPMFLGTGKHAREDLPLLITQLRLAHPAIEFRVQPAVGEDRRVLDLLASIALD
jgi:sirohydrochlorin cobaltochelatase